MQYVRNYHAFWRHRGFYEYYQIYQGEQDNETDDQSESKGKDELTSESFHSVFGFIYHVAKETGWTEKQILDMPFVKLRMMMADAPRLIKKKQTKEATVDNLKSFFGI